MAFDVSTFRDKMKLDGARPNLFEVTIDTAASYYTPSTTDGEEFNFFCKASSIPGSTLGQVVVPYFGREVKFVGNRTFADWTVTIINDENFAVRDKMESWMGSLNGHEGNTRANSNGGYSKGTVSQLGKDGKTTAIRKYDFYNIFPIDISEITLDWGDNDSIEEFTVTFAYDYWLVSS